MPATPRLPGRWPTTHLPDRLAAPTNQPTRTNQYNYDYTMKSNIIHSIVARLANLVFAVRLAFRNLRYLFTKDMRAIHESAYEVTTGLARTVSQIPSPLKLVTDDHLGDVERDLRDRIASAEDVDYQALADEVAMDTLAKYLDTYDIAQNIDLEDVARNIPTYDLARELDIDYADLAGEIDMDSLGEEIDHDALAACVDYSALARSLEFDVNDIDEDKLNDAVRLALSGRSITITLND